MLRKIISSGFASGFLLVSQIGEADNMKLFNFIKSNVSTET